MKIKSFAKAYGLAEYLTFPSMNSSVRDAECLQGSSYEVFGEPNAHVCQSRLFQLRVFDGEVLKNWGLKTQFTSVAAS